MTFLGLGKQGGPNFQLHSIDGEIYSYAVISGVVPDTTMRAFTERPWGTVFAPQRRYSPIAAAAASAPTITALSAISITATSAQPRISYA